MKHPLLGGLVLSGLLTTLSSPVNAQTEIKINIAMHNGATTVNAMSSRPSGAIVNTTTETWNNPARNGSGAPNLGLGTSFSNLALDDSDGNPSGASLTVSSGFTTFNNNGWGASTQDAVMMEGWYGFVDSESFTVDNLPAAFTSSGYKVIIYGDSNDNNRDMSYVLGGETRTILDRGAFGGSFAEGDNWIMFDGLTGSSFTITGNPNNGDPRSAINGVQIFATPPTASINSFTATPANISGGQSSTLSWDISNADTLEILPDVGIVSGATGSVVVSPATTTSYTLVASDAVGSDVAQVQVTVDGGLLPLLLNEFMADNSGLFPDGDGNPSDWIEIFNPNLVPVDIAGYGLSDDPVDPLKWTFPPGTQVPGTGYLVVFASGQLLVDHVDADGNLHTIFSLSRGGEYLGFATPDGTVIGEFAPAYPSQMEDVSFGPPAGGGSPGFFIQATPGAVNSAAVQGFVADTKFTPDRGFYNSPVAVTITTSTENANIYYTTDGTEPSQSNGTIYTAPVNVSTTTTLRAAAFRNGFQPTNVDTHTYLFTADVLTQGNSPAGYPSTWAGHPADYEMDPDVVNDPAYAPDMEAALKKFPTLSLALPPDSLFDSSSGIYVNASGSGDAWERAVSAELMFADGSEEGFEIDCGIRMQGGSSRNADTPKHSMSLRFRQQYGEGKLRYPLFQNSPSGYTAVEEFDVLQMRSGYNFGWIHRHWYQARYAQYNRDQWANDLFLAMGQPGSHGRWVHLYFNGIYWGIYHLHERPDSRFMASYFGGDDEEYDALNSGTAVDGNKNSWNAMYGIAQNNIADPAQYAAIQEYLDVENLADYMLMNFYVGNNDWDGHNWRAGRKRETGAGYLFFPWDTEFAISTHGGGVFNNPSPLPNAINTNRTGLNGSGRPSGLHQLMTQNAEYRLLFSDRAQKHMFNGGPLTPEGATAIWRARSDDMDDAIIAESARWGDFKRDVESNSWPSSNFDLFTKNDSYLPTQNIILDTYLPVRTGIVIDQLKTRNLYPDVDAPVFSVAGTPQHGGPVDTGDAVTIIAPGGSGTIYYTLDGSDPRIAPTGMTTATVLHEENAEKTAFVPIDDSLDTASPNWREAGFDDSGWLSGNLGVGYAAAPGDPYDAFIGIDVQNEMMGINETVYIRSTITLPDPALYNSFELRLRYEDGFIAYIDGVEVARSNAPASAAWNSGATGSNPDSAAVEWEAFDITAGIVGLGAGPHVLAIQGLNNGAGSSDLLISAQIRGISGSASGAVGSVYTGPVSLNTPGPVTISARVLDGGDWSALSCPTFFVGSIPANASNLVISEIDYHPADARATEIALGITNRDRFEFLEFMNIAAETIDLGGVRFTEGIDYEFHPGTLLPAGERLVLARDAVAFETRYGSVPFAVFANATGLSNGGEQLRLLAADGSEVRDFSYNDEPDANGDWPEAADGNGFSLVLAAPVSNPDHGLASSWRASYGVGGSPGGETAAPGDWDGDQLADLLELALGTDATDPGDRGTILASVDPVDVGGSVDDYLTISYERPTNAPVPVTVEWTENLVDWESGPGYIELVSSTPNPDGTTTEVYRSALPHPANGREFLRLRATAP